MNASQIFVASIAEQVTMPEVYTRIRALIDNEDARVQDFVDIIEHDRMLSDRLLRIASSRYFGYPPRANNLHQAISLIGVMQLHDLVLNCLCMRTFMTVPRELFNMRAFWEYSVECGIASRTLAQYARIFPLNPYFTLGLLHEVGHAVMFFKDPEQSTRALDQAESQQRGLAELETELFGFDYTQAGDALMQLWELPPRFRQVALHHLDPVQADKPHFLPVYIVHLAHRLCQASADEAAELVAQARELDPQLSRLPDNIVTIIEQEVTESTGQVLSMLLPHGDAVPEGLAV